MKKHIQTLLVASMLTVLIAGCYTKPPIGIPIGELNKELINMTKDKFIEQYGQPLSCDYVNEQWILLYRVEHWHMQHFIFNKDELLIGWKEREEEYVPASNGINTMLVVPFPPVK